MTTYINVLTLLFILSWLIPFTALQAFRGAYTHYIFYVECVTCCMMCYEMYREIIILTWHVQIDVTPLRVWLYGVEHIFLGMVIREVLLYVERCQKIRKRSRDIR